MKLEITKTGSVWKVRADGREISTTEIEATLEDLMKGAPAPPAPVWPLMVAAVALGLGGLVVAFGAWTVARWVFLAVLVAVLAGMAFAGRKCGRDE